MYTNNYIRAADLYVLLLRYILLIVQKDNMQWSALILGLHKIHVYIYKNNILYIIKHNLENELDHIKPKW